MYVKITYNASTMYFSLRCPPPNIMLLFWGSRNQIMVFVTTELFNPIQHTCSVFIVVVVVVLFYFAYQTHCFFVVVIAVTVVAVLSLI